MLKYYYKWRYDRSQRAAAFRLPNQSLSRRTPTVTLSSYLSQPSVRGREFRHFDFPINGKRAVYLLVALSLLFFAAWFVYESMAALAIFNP